MKLHEIQNLLKAEALTEINNVNVIFSDFKASDLMSDVLTSCESGSLLITGLTNSQAIRTAEIVDVGAIVFVRGKRPPQETIRLAQERNIHLLLTKMAMFEACGILFSKKLLERKK